MTYPEKHGSLTLEYKRLAAIEAGITPTKLNSRLILLMGTTGSGKSKFIESLCPEQFEHFKISGNSLDSVTQDVVAYTIFNASWGISKIPIVLIDTPGFSDPNLSEGKIVFALQDWLAKNETNYYHHILFFERITDNRMSGHKQRLLSIFKALVGPDSATAVTIVTSMWNQLWADEQLQAAEDRYMQLQNEHWKDILQQGAQMVKFHCTKPSAAAVLGKSLDARSPRTTFAFFSQEACITDDSGEPPSYVGMLYGTLCERVEALETRLSAIAEDLVQDSTQSDDVLKDYLQSERMQVQSLLQTFKDDLDIIIAISPSLKPIPSNAQTSIQSEATTGTQGSPTASGRHGGKRWWNNPFKKSK